MRLYRTNESPFINPRKRYYVPVLRVVRLVVEIIMPESMISPIEATYKSNYVFLYALQCSRTTFTTIAHA